MKTLWSKLCVSLLMVSLGAVTSIAATHTEGDNSKEGRVQAPAITCPNEEIATEVYEKLMKEKKSGGGWMTAAARISFALLTKNEALEVLKVGQDPARQMSRSTDRCKSFYEATFRFFEKAKPTEEKDKKEVQEKAAKVLDEMQDSAFLVDLKSRKPPAQKNEVLQEIFKRLGIDEISDEAFAKKVSITKTDADFAKRFQSDKERREWRRAAIAKAFINHPVVCTGTTIVIEKEVIDTRTESTIQGRVQAPAIVPGAPLCPKIQAPAIPPPGGPPGGSIPGAPPPVGPGIPGIPGQPIQCPPTYPPGVPCPPGPNGVIPPYQPLNPNPGNPNPGGPGCPPGNPGGPGCGPLPPPPEGDDKGDLICGGNPMLVMNHMGQCVPAQGMFPNQGGGGLGLSGGGGGGGGLMEPFQPLQFNPIQFGAVPTFKEVTGTIVSDKVAASLGGSSLIPPGSSAQDLLAYFDKINAANQQAFQTFLASIRQQQVQQRGGNRFAIRGGGRGRATLARGRTTTRGRGRGRGGPVVTPLVPGSTTVNLDGAPVVRGPIPQVQQTPVSPVQPASTTTTTVTPQSQSRTGEVSGGGRQRGDLGRLGFVRRGR